MTRPSLVRIPGWTARPAMTSRPDLPGDVEIVVVGAGVAGLCSALFLAQAGREVAVLDRAA